MFTLIIISEELSEHTILFIFGHALMLIMSSSPLSSSSTARQH